MANYQPQDLAPVHTPGRARSRACVRTRARDRGWLLARRHGESVIDLLANDWSEILKNYPRLTHEDIHACHFYASTLMKSERVYPNTAMQDGVNATSSGWKYSNPGHWNVAQRLERFCWRNLIAGFISRNRNNVIFCYEKRERFTCNILGYFYFMISDKY